MSLHLNRFMALIALCGLLTQPAIAAPDGYQTMVMDGDTLVVQVLAEPLPTGYQTMVVDGDTLVVQVLAEPLPTDKPLSAASDDSLSAQKEVMENKGMKKRSRGAGERLALFGTSAVGGFIIGSLTGGIVAEDKRDGSSLFTDRDLGGLAGFVVGVIIGLGLAADPPEQAEAPSKPDQARRFSIGLIPDTRGRFSAAATLHF